MNISFIQTDELTKKQIIQLFELWNKEYPTAVHYKTREAFEQYLNELTDKHHILVTYNETISGWFFDFIRDNQRWFAMMLDSSIQGKGIGKQLLSKAKEQHSELRGWVIESSNYIKSDGTPYPTPIGFYEKNGFDVFPDTVLKNDKLEAILIQWNR